MSREDQRALRREHQPQFAAHAGPASKALYAVKRRDEARGAWPLPAIPTPGESPAERLAAALARGDFDAAMTALAPWTRATWTAAKLKAAVESVINAVAADMKLSVAPLAAGWRVWAAPMGYEEARRSDRIRLPAEVTAENYLAWNNIEITTDEDDEFLTDVGTLAALQVVVVATGEGERVGYLAFAD